ncbi:MAG: TetR family transcriptional regulator [Oscillospiraceae bacterium]
MQVCKGIVSRQGLAALNMRAVARECGTALGTLYNYYSDKDELVLATIGSIWQDIFRAPRESTGSLLFTEYVGGLFGNIRSVSGDYPGFFAEHSAAAAGTGGGKAREAMEKCFAEVKEELLSALRSDVNIKPSAFSGGLTQEAFVKFVLDNIILLLSRSEPDIGILTEIIRRTLYTDK